MPWLPLLLQLLELALQFLLSRRGARLGLVERRRLDRLIARCRRLEYEAVRCGCLPGGWDSDAPSPSEAGQDAPKQVVFSRQPGRVDLPPAETEPTSGPGPEPSPAPEPKEVDMSREQLKALILSGAHWLDVLGTLTGRAALVAAAAALNALANNDAQLDAVIGGAAGVMEAWNKLMEWLGVHHPEAALALSAPAVRAPVA